MRAGGLHGYQVHSAAACVAGAVVYRGAKLAMRIVQASNFCPGVRPDLSGRRCAGLLAVNSYHTGGVFRKGWGRRGNSTEYRKVQKTGTWAPITEACMLRVTVSNIPEAGKAFIALLLLKISRGVKRVLYSLGLRLIVFSVIMVCPKVIVFAHAFGRVLHKLAMLSKETQFYSAALLAEAVFCDGQAPVAHFVCGFVQLAATVELGDTAIHFV